jgi:hypothetical protein
MYAQPTKCVLEIQGANIFALRGYEKCGKWNEINGGAKLIRGLFPYCRRGYDLDILVTFST